jgi:hypothetical protein
VTTARTAWSLKTLQEQTIILASQSVMTFLRIVIALQLFVLRMIFSENRSPLFGIMRRNDSHPGEP